MKKTIKMIIILIAALILIWCSMLVTDIICPIYFDKKPVFASVDVTTIQKDGGSALYNGIGYSIQTKVNLSVDNGTSIDYIKVKIFNIFKFTMHTHL